MDGQFVYDPVSRYPPSKLLGMMPGCAMFPLLESVLDPTQAPPRSLRDVVLVSIDLEFTQDGHCITQAGVAILDTQSLSSIDTESAQQLQDAVQGHCFNVYPQSKRVLRGRKKPMFMWGPTESIDKDDLRTRMKEILCDTPNIGSRNVIVVGNGIRHDRRVLINTIGFDIKGVPSVKAILDTGRMFCNAYDFGISNQGYFPLSSTLRCLGVYYERLHNAGNDAIFTMKALLLIFANWKHRKLRHLRNVLDRPSSNVIDRSSGVKRELLWDIQIETLAAIARKSWPDTSVFAPLRATKYQRPVKVCQIDALDDQNMVLEDLFRKMAGN